MRARAYRQGCIIHISVGDPSAVQVICGLNKGFTKVCICPRVLLDGAMNSLASLSPALKQILERIRLTTALQTAFYPIQCVIWNKKPHMNIFATRDEKFHRDEKRPGANAYAVTSLLELEPVDLGAWLQYYALDLVGGITFAKKLGSLEEGRDIDGAMKTIRLACVAKSPRYTLSCLKPRFSHS